VLGLDPGPVVWPAGDDERVTNSTWGAQPQSIRAERRGVDYDLASGSAVMRVRSALVPAGTFCSLAVPDPPPEASQRAGLHGRLLGRDSIRVA
jgi:hypothetical protein